MHQWEPLGYAGGAEGLGGALEEGGEDRGGVDLVEVDELDEVAELGQATVQAQRRLGSLHLKVQALVETARLSPDNRGT